MGVSAPHSMPVKRIFSRHSLHRGAFGVAKKTPHPQRVGEKTLLASEGAVAIGAPGEKPPPFALRGGVGGGPYGLKGPSPPLCGEIVEKRSFV